MRVERANLGDGMWLQLIATDAEGRESASVWSRDFKAAVKQVIAAAEVEMNAMLVGDGKMYLKHFATKWTNRASDLQRRLDSIAAMISLGRKMGCDMSEEIALASMRYLPQKPL